MGLFSPQAVILALRRLVLIVVVSALAGVLMAGLVLPVTTGLGLSARSGAEAFSDMDDEIHQHDLAERSIMTDADGRKLAIFYEENRIFVPLDKISPVMQDAMVAVEDHRFYQHGPIDLQGTTRAFVTNMEAGETVSGGSSLTQQYVKLLLLDQADSNRERANVLADSGMDGYMRKLRELRMALNVEQSMTKDEILEQYLNIANFGGPPGRSNYGIEAAARYYFSTTAEELTLPQAATLAGLVQRPSAYDPTDNPEAAIGRRNTVLTRMESVGMITRTEAAEARQAELGLELSESPSGCLSTVASWFCDYAVAEISDMEELGDTPEEREQALMTGGLHITTTLERDIQKAANEEVSDTVAPTDSAIGTLAMVEPGTGEVKAIANSRDYGPDGEGHSMVNYAVDKRYGNANGIQAGSAFKPFVLAAAINQGMSLNLRINAPPQIHMGGERFEICWNDNTRYTADPDWSPQNSTQGGNITMRQATEWSTNTYYVQLLQRTGICEPATIAQESGVWKQVPHTNEPQPLDQVASFTLGSNTVSPLAMAGAFAMFANRGEYCEPFAIAEVRDGDGDTLVEREPECDRVLDKAVADGVNDVLHGVIYNAGATGGRMQLDGGRPAAGKTGTTNDSIAVWFVGYTPQLATAVAVADLDGKQTTLDGREYNGTYMPQAFGGTLPGPVWREVMNRAHEGLDHEDFKDPDPSIVRGVDEDVPDVRGETESRAADRLEDAGFGSHIAGRVASGLAEGVVVSTDPSGGSTAPSGTSIGLYVSSGSAPPPDDDDDDDDGDDEDDEDDEDDD